MTETKPRRSLRVPALLVVLLAGGGAVFWKARGPRRQAASPAHEAEVERRRVAALDPSFDPAKPAGSIEGVVKDPDGKPVDGAVVAVTRNRGKDELPSFGPPKPRVATTANGGRFRVPDVLAGEYSVTAAAVEGAPAREPKVAVQSGQKAEVTLTLGRGGVLFTGEVFDVGGGPIAGARALLRTVRDFKGPGAQPVVYQATSDDKGIFKVRLAEGEHSLMVRAEGYAPVQDWVALSSPQTRRYRLNPAARLAGRVLERDSRKPVAGASVWLRLDRLESYVDRETTSNNDGEFSFDDLAAAGYVVMARADRRIGLSRTVSIGIAQAVTDVEVLVESGRAIRGTVVGSDGKGIEGVRVTAGRADPPYERPVFVKSGSGGTFAVEGLLPAKYRVYGWMEGRQTAKAENAQITSKDVEGVRLTLTTSTVVRGQVVDANGKGVPEADVTAVVEATKPERQTRIDRTSTDAAGKFELTRLIAGKLTLTARHPDVGVGKWGPEELPPADAPVTVKLSAAGAVAGVVKFEDGKPAARAMVFAQPTEMGPMFGPPQQATTDEAGRFRIGGLEPKGYRIMARRADNFMGGTPRSRQDVTLAAGEEKSGLELLLPAGGKRIAGRVLSAEGKPVSGALVSAGMEKDGFAFRQPVREGGFGGALQSVSDADGNFALDDLQEGKYTLWAADSVHADGEVKGVAAGTTDVSIKLEGGASVAGVVQTRDGKPVADYSIAALPGGRPGASPDERLRNQMMARMWSPSAQVHDPAGAFSIGRLGAGAYELTVTTADNQAGVLAVNVGAGEQKSGLAVVIEAAAKLAGRVIELDSGTPLEGVSVFLASSTNRQQATTGKDGSFTIEGVSPGRGRVDFNLGNGDTHVGEHVDVEVKPGVPVVDVGTIKMMKGSLMEKTGGFATRGRVGFTVSLVDGKPSITGVIPGFPGEKHGLKQGELVLSVNGHSLDGMGNGALDYMAAGRVTEPVTVQVQPREGGAPRTVTVERVPWDYNPSSPGASRTNPPTAAK
jgi:protocatechuate 3,4-dioxygenase beta subunit